MKNLNLLNIILMKNYQNMNLQTLVLEKNYGFINRIYGIVF